MAASVHPSMGDKLRWWREERRLSRSELAAKAALSDEMIKKVETGVAMLSYDTALRVASALTIHVSYLWDHGPPPS